MIWFLITKYIAWIWGLDPITTDGKLVWAVISSVETLIEVGLLIGFIVWIFDKQRGKSK